MVLEYDIDPRSMTKSNNPKNKVKYLHYHYFLLKCVRSSLIPKGLNLKFRLGLGVEDEQLKQKSKLHLQEASDGSTTDYNNSKSTDIYFIWFSVGCSHLLELSWRSIGVGCVSVFIFLGPLESSIAIWDLSHLMQSMSYSL